MIYQSGLMSCGNSSSKSAIQTYSMTQHVYTTVMKQDFPCNRSHRKSLLTKKIAIHTKQVHHHTRPRSQSCLLVQQRDTTFPLLLFILVFSHMLSCVKNFTEYFLRGYLEIVSPVGWKLVFSLSTCRMVLSQQSLSDMFVDLYCYSSMELIVIYQFKHRSFVNKMEFICIHCSRMLCISFNH